MIKRTEERRINNAHWSNSNSFPVYVMQRDDLNNFSTHCGARLSTAGANLARDMGAADCDKMIEFAHAEKSFVHIIAPMIENAL